MQLDQENNEQIPTLYCIYGKEAYFTCAQKTCNKNSLICLTKDCECHQQNHKKCLTIRLKTIIDQVLAKKVSMSAQVTKSYKEILKIYEQMIETLSRQREYLVDNMEYYGLKKYQREFLSRIQSNLSSRLNRLNGCLVSRVMQQLSIKKKFVKFYSIEQIKQQWVNYHKIYFQQSYNRLKTYLLNDQKMLSSKIKKQIPIQSLFNEHILQFNLLYRATENNFSINKFHQKCDHINDTFIIIQTQDNCVVGGYTPIRWGSNPVQHYKADLSQKAFIFSLQKESKILLCKNRGIFNDKKSGPGFGTFINNEKRYNILINNHANQNLNIICIQDKGIKFTDTRHRFNQQDYEKQANVKILEWEVFQVIFYS